MNKCKACGKPAKQHSTAQTNECVEAQKKPWLMEVTTQEGDHEYRAYKVIRANDYKDALKVSQSLIDSGDYDFEDGLTMSEVHDITEITEAQASTLKELRVA